MPCNNCISQLAQNNKIGFREACSSCGADLHCCINCRFYDRGAYNECKEPQAERVLDKERQNRCEYFTGGSPGSSSPDKKQAALSELDKLFK